MSGQIDSATSMRRAFVCTSEDAPSLRAEAVEKRHVPPRRERRRRGGRPVPLVGCKRSQERPANMPAAQARRSIGPGVVHLREAEIWAVVPRPGRQRRDTSRPAIDLTFVYRPPNKHKSTSKQARGSFARSLSLLSLFFLPENTSSDQGAIVTFHPFRPYFDLRIADRLRP